jgi:hypothetical protein
MLRSIIYGGSYHHSILEYWYNLLIDL